MVTREQSVEIAASPETIFDLIHDYARRPLQTKPGWLRWLLTPVCKWVFSRETRGRLATLKAFLEAAP